MMNDRKKGCDANMGKETAKTLNSKMLEGLIAAASRQEQQPRNSQSLGGKKYAKISTKPRDLCFFRLLPQDDQVQQDDLIGALWVWQKRVGDGKIRRKTW